MPAGIAKDGYVALSALIVEILNSASEPLVDGISVERNELFG